MFVKARTLREAANACKLEPLESGDPRYFDFSAARDFKLKSILNSLETSAAGGDFLHFALGGHRGCGKSTELLKLSHEAEKKGFLVLYTRVNELVDPYDLDYSDLFLLIAQTIESGMRERGYSLDSRLLKNIAAWFSEVIDINEKEVKMSLGVEARAGAAAKIPFFANLMVALTSRLKAGTKAKTEVRSKVQKYPKALLDNVNLLAQEARNKLEKDSKFSQLLLIFDNIDRYRPEVIDNLLLQGGDLLNELRCHTIITVPIFLIYQPQKISLKDVFSEFSAMPMIKIREKDTPWSDFFPPGIDALFQALDQRMEVEDIFSEKELAYDFIKMSGGCLRDLMHLMHLAGNEAEEKIDAEVVKEVIRRLRLEYQYEILAEDYPRLAKLHLSKQVPNDEYYRRLLFYRHALQYVNEEVWGDVHPIIYDLSDFQKALNNEKK